MEACGGLVLECRAGTYRVEREDGVVECVLAGRLKQRGGPGRVVPGDRVELEPAGGHDWRIVSVEPRRGRLARRRAGGRSEQVIVANADALAAVLAVTRPEPDLRMLDRLLVLAELDGMEAAVVVNKVDLGPVPEGLEAVREVGYRVLAVSAREGIGLDGLRALLQGRITVLAGPSGVGKTSLLNALCPGRDLRVGAVGERSGRGRHTTVSARLVPLPDGGYLADTPGLQLLTLSEVPPGEVGRAFPELRARMDRCRFNDCRHLEEPDCAVREALRAGRIAPSRYASYRALLAEAAGRRIGS